MSARKHVAVIGAGLAGLCSLKQLSEHEDKFTIVAFERAEEVGGQWLYTEETGTDKYGLPVFSSMYDNMVTNLPTCLNEIPGFPFEKRDPFIHRQDVLDYLIKYTDTFHLRQHIKFQTIIDRVRPLSKSPETQWQVTYHSVLSPDSTSTEICDAVLVCNGHHNKPNIPAISGMDKFQGGVFHSHDYRRNTGFTGKRVVVLGAAFSGTEISCQIAETAEKVYLAHKDDPLNCKFPINVEQRPGIKGFTEDSVVFDDNTEEKVDIVMFCTGYLYDFPFLGDLVFLAHKKDHLKTKLPGNVEQRHGIDRMTEYLAIFEDGTEEKVEAVVYCTGYLYDMPFLDGIITVNNERVQPLFKHIVHIEYPTLLFVNIPKRLVYFLQIYKIAYFAVRCLLGRVNLPSKTGMYEDERKDFDNRLQMGMRQHQAHYMGVFDLQWIFVNELMELAGLPKLDPVLKKLWHDLHKKMQYNIQDFRKYRYEIDGPDSFKVMEI